VATFCVVLGEHKCPFQKNLSFSKQFINPVANPRTKGVPGAIATASLVLVKRWLFANTRGLWSKRRQTITATIQNGDNPKEI